MRFNLVTHDPDALFSIIAKQQRDQAVIEANDAVRRQTAKRRGARSMAVAGGPSRREVLLTGTTHARVPKLLVFKQNETVGTTTRNAFVCGKQGHKQRDCPKSQQGKAGKGVHVRSHGQTPMQQQQSTSGPAQHTRSKTTGMAPASATPRASPYKTASKAVVTETEPAAPEPSRQNDDDYVYIRGPRDRLALVDYGLTEMVQHRMSQSWATRCSGSSSLRSGIAAAPASQQSCGDSSIISYARVSVWGSFLTTFLASFLPIWQVFGNLDSLKEQKNYSRFFFMFPLRFVGKVLESEIGHFICHFICHYSP